MASSRESSQLGMEPMSSLAAPASAGGFFTTEPPGKCQTKYTITQSVFAQSMSDFSCGQSGPWTLNSELDFFLKLIALSLFTVFTFGKQCSQPGKGLCKLPWVESDMKEIKNTYLAFLLKLQSNSNLVCSKEGAYIGKCAVCFFLKVWQHWVRAKLTYVFVLMLLGFPKVLEEVCGWTNECNDFLLVFRDKRICVQWGNDQKLVSQKDGISPTLSLSLCASASLSISLCVCAPAYK